MNSRSSAPRLDASEYAREVWEDESPAQGLGSETADDREKRSVGAPALAGDGPRLQWRTETDSLGRVRIAQDKYWGAQTQRSLEYFAIGDARMPIDLVRAYGAIKAVCARVNAELGGLPPWKESAITRVAQEIESGLLDSQFPVQVYTTGSGTHLNANVNEVIANRANVLLGFPLGTNHPIHPLDDVNRSQSSNDTFITAMHVAILRRMADYSTRVHRLLHSLDVKVEQWRAVPKMGRTHLMDATELFVGDEWGAFHASLSRAHGRVIESSDALYEIALGGTAVGNGINAPVAFRSAVVAALSEHCGLAFREPSNAFAAQSTIDAVLEVHGALRSFAAVLFKVTNDLRWLSSGPRGGLQELVIPENEPGSTVMPGKTNPTQCEAVMMACLRVLGNDVTIGHLAAEGNFQLNTFRPLAAFIALESLGLLADASESLARNMIQGTQLQEQQIVRNRERSVMQLTSLVPYLGYERVARIARQAMSEGLTAYDAASRDGVEAEVLKVLSRSSPSL